ncbi:MAG: gamma-glutamyltransferase [Planctomycetes bacterium]|nr:gamma-glutamyltransferase [Planctomycetota bacterium]
MRKPLFILIAIGVLAMPTLGQVTKAKPKSPGLSWQAEGKNGAVCGGGEEAVAAGLAVLKKGGNAADAAVTSLFALSVTDSKRYCFGGEVPIMVYDAKRNVVELICGLGVAPKLATREFFTKRKDGIPEKGVESAAVPGMVDGALTALDRFGTITFAQAVQPTLDLLDQPKAPWHANLARTIRRMIDAEKQSPHDRKRGLRLVADEFYRGQTAREIDAWSRANNGLLRYTDLATHVTRIEDPLAVDYRGYTVYKCGEWNQGPYLLQTLRLLEGYDLKKMGHNQPDTIHVITEAMKLALADRDVYYADPLFVDVPTEALLSKKYADLRRPLIDMKSASLVRRPGDPRLMTALLKNPPREGGAGSPDMDTTTCVAADKFGNVVAATPSGFNGVVAGKTGIQLGTRLVSLNIWPGHPNCIEPGKRPRITLTPGIVFKAGKPVMAISIAGGDLQDQTGLQVMLNVLDFGMTPAEAVTAPRFATNHHLGSFRQKAPELGSLIVYPEFSNDTIADLARRGHKITATKKHLAEPSVIVIDRRTGLLRAAGDPRAKRHAGAY